MNGSTEKKDRSHAMQIFRSSTGITLMSLFSMGFGFLTQVILAARFGTGKDMDAFFVSITIPMMFISIVGSCLNYTFMPVYVEKKSKGGDSEAWDMAGNLINLSVVIFVLFACAGMIWSSSIIHGSAPGLSPESSSLGAELFMIQVAALPFSGVSVILSCMYYAERRFLYPSLATLANSGIICLCTWTLSGIAGIRAPAWGYLLGCLCSFALLVPAMAKIPAYRFSLRLTEKGTLVVFRLMLPLILGSVFYRADDLIQRYLASALEAGSISYLGYAFKLITALSGLIVSGISIVFLQRMSELRSKGDAKGMGIAFSTTFRWLTFATIPVIVGFILLGREITVLLFQRGKFDILSAHATWICLMLYSGVLYGTIVGAVTTPIFYAYKNTRIVMKLGVAGALLQLALSYGFSKFMSYPGVALGYSVSNLCTICAFLFVMDRMYVKLPLKEMFGTVVSASVAGAVVVLIFWPLKPFLLADSVSLVRIMTVVPLLGIVYVGVCMGFRIREAVNLWTLARGAFGAESIAKYLSRL